MSIRVYYYSTQADAATQNTGIAIAENNNDSYVVGDATIPGNLQGFTKWIIGAISTGPLLPTIYNNTDSLSAIDDPVYYLYPVRVLYYSAQSAAVTGASNYFATNSSNYTVGTTVAPIPQNYTKWFVDHTTVGAGPSITAPYDVYTNTTSTFLPLPNSGTVYYLYPARIVYYNSQAAAAIGGADNIARNLSAYQIGNDFGGSLNGFSSWRIDPTQTTGTSPTNVVYANTATLNGPPGAYFLYPLIPCFLEGTRILCQVDGTETYLPIETLQSGTLVKTSRDGFKAVELIGKRTIANSGTSERTEDRLYTCSKAVYPELTEDLIVTGCHSILVDTLTDVQREATLAALGKIFVTDRKYRLMAHIDERAEPWASAGDHTVWHFALENEDDGMNYGVYANGGLLVESCSIRFLKNRSNMTLL